jgi:hypothetical protein
MSEPVNGEEKVSTGAKAIFILLAGALSMFFAEVCSGSSVLWFVTPWAWLVTFWLYLAHTILFVNLALRFRRTSLTALYLWGVFFGLYEAWITKVTWAGYMGQAPSMGTFLGFAVQEFPLIVFFWHPVMSFILPVLAFEALSGRILPEHVFILTKSRRNWLLAVMVVVLSAAFLSFNSRMNIVATVVTILGSFALIGALYLVSSKRYGGKFSIESLRLGRVGMALLLMYLALLYSLTFVFILPERIAPPLTILLTIGVYAVIAILLYLKRPDETAMHGVPAGKNTLGIKELAALAAVFIVLAALLCLIAPVDQVLTVVLYVGLFFLSPVLLILAAVNVLKSRRQIKAPGAR